MLSPLVASTTLIAFVIAASACTPLKARDADRNEGGGSMYRTTDFSRSH